MKLEHGLGALVAMIAAAASPAAVRSGASVFSLEQQKHIQILAKTPTVTHQLADTVFHDGDLEGSAQAEGFFTIDTYDFKCGQDRGCTIDVAVQSEYGSNSLTGNRYSTCVLVDGAYLAPACPIQGEIPTDASYVSAVVSAWGTVTKGKHTVTVQGYSDQGATEAYWKTTYNIYAP